MSNSGPASASGHAKRTIPMPLRSCSPSKSASSPRLSCGTLHIGGQVIRTTPEHRFWVASKGWTSTKDLVTGDELIGLDGQRVAVEDLLATGEVERVYNFRVAEHHTYFVGAAEWGFEVWAHNICFGTYGSMPSRKGFQRHHVNQDKAFDSVIPRKDGLTIYLQGGTNVVGSVHYRFHQSLNRLWKPYCTFGIKLTVRPLVV